MDVRPLTILPYLRMVSAGFHRYATYRQAMIAGMITNTVFGLLRTGVLLAVFTARPLVAGYTAEDVVTYVWLGQALLGVVQLWGDHELAERIRTGDVAIDLARPWNLQVAMLAEDLGRAGFATLLRFVPLVAVGSLLFAFRWPTHPATWVAFPIGALLAVCASFLFRFLIDLTAFWLLDIKGIHGLSLIATNVLAGLIVPLAFFPDWMHPILWATPFPALLQAPIDIFTEQGSALPLLGYQLACVLILYVICRHVLRRAEYKLVVQGG